MAHIVSLLDPGWLIGFINEYAGKPRREAGRSEGDYASLECCSHELGDLVSELTGDELVELANLLYGALSTKEPDGLASQLDVAVRKASVRTRALATESAVRVALETDGPSTALLLAAVMTLEQALEDDRARPRVGVCEGARCADIYLDRSRAASRRFCSHTCQNRAKVAAFRARRRNAGSSG